MVRFLGYFNASIIVVLSLRRPYFVWFKQSKKPPWSKRIAKAIRKTHPILGGIVGITGILHGYMAWGWNFRHTGYLLYLFVLAQNILGIGLLRKKRSLKKLHRIISLITLVLLGLHIFYRSALS